MLKHPNLELHGVGLAATGAAAPAAHSQPGDRPSLEIRPRRGALDLDLAAIWRHRELLQFLVLREIKVRYKQAALGVAWTIIQPVFAALIFTVVFGIFARVPSDGIPYALFALSAIIPWTYFAEALRRGSTGLVADAELIRKIYFPRLVLPLAAVIAPLFDLAVSFVVFAVVMAWYGVAPNHYLVLLPAFIAMSACVSLAFALWLGPLNVRYRDVKQILPFLLQIWMYASPIVYPVTLVPERWRLLYSLNPMVAIIQGFRWTLLGTAPPSAAAMILTVTLTVVLLLGGLVYFRRAERSFADVI
jgi:lipopolysaccharide transport system permease protein